MSDKNAALIVTFVSFLVIISGCADSDDQPMVSELTQQSDDINDSQLLARTEGTVWKLVSASPLNASKVDINPEHSEFFTLQYSVENEISMLKGNHVCVGYGMTVTLNNDLVMLGGAIVTDATCSNTHPMDFFVGSMLFSMENLLVTGDELELTLTQSSLGALTYRP